MSTANFRVSGRNSCVRLRDERLLEPPCGLEILQCRSLCVGSRFSSGESGPVVTIVELHQQLARLDALVIGDGDLFDETSHLGRNDSDVTANIGIVGTFEESTHGHPVIAVGHHSRGSKPDGTVNGQPLDPYARNLLRSGRDYITIDDGSTGVHDEVLTFVCLARRALGASLLVAVARSWVAVGGRAGVCARIGRCIFVPAAGTVATLNSGPRSTRPLRLSTNTGSACSPVSAST